MRDGITVFGLLAVGVKSRLMAGLAGICSIRGEDVADPFTEVLMYFWAEAVRAAGSGAVGSIFIGDLGEAAVCCGLSARGSTVYLPLTGLEGAWLY